MGSILKLPDALVLQYDTAEKRPTISEKCHPHELVWSDHRGNAARFPIEVERIHLKTFDYGLAARYGDELITYPHIVGIEKKGTWREVCQNTETSDGRRFSRCLRRMGETKYPYLLLTFDPTVPDPYAGRRWTALDKLFRACHNYGIRLLCMPAATPKERLAVGELLIHLMWTHIWETLNEEYQATLMGSSARPSAV